jgi:hypothetical protein
MAASGIMIILVIVGFIGLAAGLVALVVYLNNKE